MRSKAATDGRSSNDHNLRVRRAIASSRVRLIVPITRVDIKGGLLSDQQGKCASKVLTSTVMQREVSRTT
ncbi:hypothetical protein [Tardisphaera saccharovorans]